MSSREEKAKKLTTKERIVYIAQKDPFLKVKEIAELADTTSHYVRTVLSEADISLVQLRKSYAEAGFKTSKEELLLYNSILSISVGLSLNRKLDFTLFTTSNYYQKFSKGSNSLIEATRVFEGNKSPQLLSTCFLEVSNPEIEMSELIEKSDLNFSPLEIEGRKARKKITDNLDLVPNTYLLFIKRKIFLNSRVKGLEAVFCNPAKVKLVMVNGRLKFVYSDA